MEQLNSIQEKLLKLQDSKYRDFQAKLIPTVPPASIIGVRTPALRSYAKQLAGQEDAETFLEELPHRYFDENQLHAFLLSEESSSPKLRGGDFSRCIEGVNRFLPFIDNWATCDQLSPKCFKKHRPELLGSIREWLASSATYTVRFGIGMLMEHFLDADFDPAYPDIRGLCSASIRTVVMKSPTFLAKRETFFVMIKSVCLADLIQ